MKRLFILLFFPVLLTACQPGSRETQDTEPETAKVTGSFSISGAYAIYPLLKIWTEEFMKMHPGVTINLVKEGTGRGIENLRLGNSHIAMISREMSPEEEALGYAIFAVAKDAVVPIINSRNPVIEQILEKGMSHRQLQILFSMDDKPTWGEIYMKENDAPVNVYIRSDPSGAAMIWSNFLLVDNNDLNGTGLEGDDLMVQQVLADSNSIGYCNMIYIWDSTAPEVNPGLLVVPFDLNYNGRIDYREKIPRDMKSMRRYIQLGKFPHSLCRYLYLLEDPKTSNETLKAFLIYVMTEGQSMVENAGYCKVPGFILDCQVNKLRKGK